MSNITTFEDFDLTPALHKDIKTSGYVEPTPIQVSAIPVVLEGHDVLGQAHTGTGKTASFAIPMITKIDTRNRNIQGIVLTPTRELAIQVSSEIYKLGKSSRIKELPIYGGQHIDHQMRALRNHPQIIVGTPGRVIDHLKRGTLKLDDVTTVVIDEADEMLDMGFIEDIEFILGKTPVEKQMLLFSATLPHAIKKIVNRYMNNPKTISVIKEGDTKTSSDIEQTFYEVPDAYKLEALCRLIDFDNIDFAIIFCRTKIDCSELSSNLKQRGYMAEALHGDLTQAQRNKVMKQFKDKKLEYLVATDVAARGIDVSNVTHVINYHIPQNPEHYIHRIGRTGRAGQKGTAVTIINRREFGAIRGIERLTKSRIQKKELPSVKEMLVKQEEFLETKIKNILDKGKLDIYTNIIENLKDTYTPEELSTALLKLYFDDKQIMVNEISTGKDKGSRDRSNSFGGGRNDRGGRSDRSGRGDNFDSNARKVFVAAGRDDGVDNTDIYRGILDSSSIDKRALGRIKVYDKFSFVEITHGDVEDFLYNLQKLVVKGRRVNVEIAKTKKRKPSY